MNDPRSGAASSSFGRFFLPGPTEVLPEVLEAQTRPMISHRGSGSAELMKELHEGLQVLFLTQRPVLIGTCSATGFMEAAIRNSGGVRILALVNGAFSDRFAKIGVECGFEVDRYEVPWGEAHDPEQLRKRLKQGSYGAVSVVHSETSTSVLNDVRALAAVTREHGDVVFMVDTVSSFAAAEFRTDEWAIDFVFTGSQKAFALPPGLAFGVASERMMERSKRSPGKGYYLDLDVYAQNAAKYQSPSTPALSTLFALQVQLRRMLQETIERRWARHTAMAERTYAWVEEMRAQGVGLRLYAPEGYRSPAVTAIETPSGKTGPDIVKAMRERGYVIGGGYGKLKDTTIRIGHMGEQTVDTLENLLGVLAEVVR